MKTRPSFLHRAERPSFVALMAKNTRDEYIAEAIHASLDGADGIAVGMGSLKPEFRTREDLEKLFSCVDLPFYVLFYRNDQWIPENTKNDEARQEVLLCAADAGAAMIDVMGDLYDPSPMEITRKPEAVERQKKLIEKIHAKGAEVVISSHMQTARTAEETLEHLQSLAARGADLVKIVTAINTPEELAEAVRTTLLLKKEMKVPFIHLCGGSYGKFHRFFAPTLGSSMNFISTGYPVSPDTPQPMTEALKSVYETIRRSAGTLRC